MAMHVKIKWWKWFLASAMVLAALLVVSTGLAQQEIQKLIITGSDSSSAPTIDLYVIALDAQGNVVPLTAEALTIEHNGQPVSNVTIGNPREVGTFTIFLVDIPGGVAAQVSTVQDAIQQYAADPFMKEGVDYVAIFRVDELAASPLLQADSFYNSVRNAFANPLTPSSGATALVDSLMGLLNNLGTLKPDPELAAHIVVMSDGTDIVSTQFQEQAVAPKAVELGVPIHTVILNNQSITSANKQGGETFLTQLAADTGGASFPLTTAEALQPTWQRIAAFRAQPTVQYTVDSAAGGDFDVKVSLASNPAVQAVTSISLPIGAPSIAINIPPESLELTLTTLDQPINLALSTSVSWLDNVDRQLTKAQLLVNGLVVQDIDPAQLSQFEAVINNFQFGANRIQIAIVDDQGGRATSPEVILNITQGQQDIIPEAIAPSGGFLSGISGRFGSAAIFGGGCFMILLVLLLFVVLAIIGRHNSFVQSLGLANMLYWIPPLRPFVADAVRVQRKMDQGREMGREAGRYSGKVRGTGKSKTAGAKGIQAYAYLEILEAVTSMPNRVDLGIEELRLGRSANQANLVFNNDSTVSRIHAKITLEGSDYRIHDEQSTSGTWVNELRVPAYGLQLTDGDEIRLGAVRIRFRQP